MKKLSKHVFFSFLFLSISSSLFSQSTQLLFKEGHKLFKQEHYRKALPYLEKVVEAEPANAEAIFETGVCYLHRYSKEKALDYILEAYRLDSNCSKFIHFWLGRAYHQNYQYDKAIREYNIYKSSLKVGDERKREADKHIQQTKNAREFTSNPDNFRVFNLGPVVNSLYSEHSPVSNYNDSLLLFTSRRNDVTGGKEDYDGEFFEDIFQTGKTSGGWTAPEKIALNTSGHDASIQLFDKDTKMLLYRQDKGGDILITERVAGSNTWKDPQKFADINTADYESEAFITADGKRAYFATNHYKKIGDLDIYYIERKDDGSWGRPMELPGKINTSEDEQSPYVSADGKTLYFSSRGHKNMGGFDVFKSTMDKDGKWSAPVNLGYPINTPDDDVFYFMQSNGKKAYISSYREGGYGEKDIYEVAPIPPVTVICKLTFCQEKNGEINYSLKSLKKTTRPLTVTGKVDNNNKFTTKITSFNSYRLAIYNSRDTLYAETFDVPFMEDDNKIIEKTINVLCEGVHKDSIAVKDTVIVREVIEAPILKYVFRDFTFEKGTLNLTDEAYRELQTAEEILKKNPTAEVSIVGATSREEKRSLAGKRAQVVYEEFIKRGVTNVKIDENVETSGTGSSARKASLNVKMSGPLATDFDPAIIPHSSVGSRFVLRNLYFEAAKWELRDVAKAELDMLAEVMKEFPEVAIEIAGHTDNRGSDSLNLELSEKRAKIAMEYLVSKGVSPDRVTAKGYGETQPVAPNENDAGRLLNRRTELRIRRNK